MTDIIIWLGIIAVFIIAVWYILTQISLPDPIYKIVIVVLVVVVAVAAISFLAGGMHLPRLR